MEKTFSRQTKNLDYREDPIRRQRRLGVNHEGTDNSPSEHVLGAQSTHYHDQGLYRSDSGIDNQSLLMEGQENQSHGNHEWPSANMRNIIKIAILIQIIEQKIKTSKRILDLELEKIQEYYRLKRYLTDLASRTPSDAVAMITVVKQLEPIAECVENYFRLSNEAKDLYEQINTTVQRKNTLQNKRFRLLKILETSINWNHQPESLFHSESCDITKDYSLHSRNFDNLWSLGKKDNSVPSKHNSYITEIQHNDLEMWKDVSRPMFNVDGLRYEEHYLSGDNEVTPHNRSICREYINERAMDKKSQTVEVMISSFPEQSISIVHLKAINLLAPLETSRHYKVRILQSKSTGSDWSNACLSEDGTHISMSPNLILPVKWDFKSNVDLKLLIEVQMIEKNLKTFSACFVFSILPERSVEKVSVPLHSMKSWAANCGTKLRRELQGANPPSTPLTQTGAAKHMNRPGVHPRSQPIIIGNNAPIQRTGIRRSQTYNHDHSYYRKIKDLLSTDFLSVPLTKVNPGHISEPIYLQGSKDNSDVSVKARKEPRRISTSSSFKRQSILRQPIRLKHNSLGRDVSISQHNEVPNSRNHPNFLEELLSDMSELHAVLNLCKECTEILREYEHFRQVCPSDLKSLYDYFVDIIFDCNSH